MIDNLKDVPRSKQEVFLVRIPAEMYEPIKTIAEEQGRTIQMQTQILLGAALNRNLISPADAKPDAEVTSN